MSKKHPFVVSTADNIKRKYISQAQANDPSQTQLSNNMNKYNSLIAKDLKSTPAVPLGRGDQPNKYSSFNIKKKENYENRRKK